MRYLRKPAIIAALAAGAFGVAQPATAESQPSRNYVVVYEQGQSAKAAHQAIAAAGGKLVKENAKIGAGDRRLEGSRVHPPGDRPARAARRRARPSDRPYAHRRPRPLAGHRARRPRHQGKPGKTPAPAPADEPLAGLQWDMQMIDATADGLLPPPAGLARGPRRHPRHGRRRHPPGHRAELRHRAVAQLHHRRPVDRRRRAPTSPTSPARTRRTSTRTATARTSPARSASPLNGLGIAGVAPKVDTRQPPRRPGLGLLLPRPDARRADLRGRPRHRRREHVATTSIRGSTTARPTRRTRRPSSASSARSSRPRSARSTTRAQRGVTLDRGRGQRPHRPRQADVRRHSPGLPVDAGDPPRAPAHDRQLVHLDADRGQRRHRRHVGRAEHAQGRTTRTTASSRPTWPRPGGDSRDDPATPGPRRRTRSSPPTRSRVGDRGRRRLEPATARRTTPVVATARRARAYYQYIQGTSMASPHAVGRRGADRRRVRQEGPAATAG